MAESIHQRKAEHIKWCLTDDVLGEGITTGLEKVRLIHNALPEINFDDVSLATSLFGRTINTPFLISSMTGGAALAGSINEHLARACEARGWVFALGSTRALIEDEHFRQSFKVRPYAPTIPIIANLGAVQLNYGFTEAMCQTIIDETEATALVLHLNSIQELIQTGGDTNFQSLLPKIESLVKTLDVPVGVKEVGFGIDGHLAKQLTDIGIQFIDVAGAGGTSWSQVEKLRSKDPIKKQAAEAFTSWGIPTVESLRAVRANTNQPVFASGGMRTGVDAVKAIGLGADLVGYARGILKEATDSVEAVMETMAVRELELKMAMFGLGHQTIDELKQSNRVIID
jgi:isopentenyl-diphosphate delta-isomerase